MTNKSPGVSHQKKPGLGPVEASVVTRTTLEVMNELDNATRILITQKDAKNYTSKEKQKAAVGFLASLINQQSFRERYVEFALNNPGEAMKHAIATLPKELHVESHSYLENMHVLAPLQTMEQWQALVKQVAEQPKTIDAETVNDKTT